jgi:tripartite ATP-independent transporter DctP family solute receptor
MNLLSKMAIAGVALGAFVSSANALELKMNGLHAPSHPASMAHDFFGDRVKELTGGAIDVDVHHARGLCDAVECVQMIRNGTIAFFDVSAANLSQVDKRLDMFTLPYLFKSKAHYWNYLTSARAAEFVKPLEKKGIKVLGYIDSGARSFFTQKPIRTVADVKGQKIRVMGSPVAVATIGAMGGTGVPVAWGELYNALQTGVVDGAENNHPSVLSMKFYEVSKYYTLDEHARIPDMLIMSLKTYNALPADQQQAIEQAGREAEAFMRGAWTVSEVTALAQLKSKFTEIIEVDKGPFIAAVADLVAKESARLGVAEEVKHILSTGENF